jgi:LPXTG-motif cell wall-anchored protein
MRDARHLATLLVVLGAFALAVPAVALAGGSAGNNQYTNPFGGSTTAPQTTSAPPQTSSTTAPQTSTASAPPTTASPPATTSVSAAGTSTSVVTSSDPTSDPTATAAASPGGATTTGGKGLPNTGYADWEIAGFGLVMLAGGFVIRRRRRA